VLPVVVLVGCLSGHESAPAGGRGGTSPGAGFAGGGRTSTGGGGRGTSGAGSVGGEPGGGEAGDGRGGAMSGSGGESGHAAASGDGGGSVGGEAGAGGDAGMGGTSDERGAAEVRTMTELVNAFCARAVECCDAQGGFVWFSVQSCVDQVVGSTPMQSIGTGTVVLDDAQVTACRAAIDASVGNCGPIPPGACTHLYRGTRKPGEPCADGRDCARGNDNVGCFVDGSQYDGSQDDTARGVCKATPGGAEGARCAATCPKGSNCALTLYNAHDTPSTVCVHAEGLWCDAIGSGVCEHTVGEFEFCVDDYSCEAGAVCYFDPTVPSGRIDTYCLGSGGGCDCESGFTCATGNRCEPAANFEQSLDCFGSSFIW